MDEEKKVAARAPSPEDDNEDGPSIRSGDGDGDGDPPPPLSQEKPDIPNGGLTAWLQVLGSFVLFLNSWGIVNTFGVYQAYYATHLGQSPSNISWIGSIQAYLLLLVGVVTGPLYDAGYFRSLLLTGSFLVVFGMMMTSICTEYWQLMLAQAVCIGVGCGCIFVPSVAIIPTYFSTKKALATGIAAAGSSFGGVIFPIVFNRLLPRIGFGWATRVIAFIMLATLTISLSVMRVRVRPAQSRKLWQLSALTEPPFALFTIGTFFVFCGLYIPFFYTQSYAIAENIMSPDLAQYLFSILNAGSIFGRIIPNHLADRVGPLNVLIPATLVACILAFSWLSIKYSAGLIVFAAMYGFVSGSFVSLPPTVLFTLSPDKSVLGTRMGMNFALGGLGILIGTPVAGHLVRETGYHAAIAFCGAMIGCGVFCLILARAAKVGLRVVANA